jgi:hypothetical protein
VWRATGGGSLAIRRPRAGIGGVGVAAALIEFTDCRPLSSLIETVDIESGDIALLLPS